MQAFIDRMASAFQKAEVLAHPEAVVLRSFPRSIQLDRHSCGARSVWCILRYFGIRVSHKRLEQMLGTNEDTGTDVSRMKKVLRGYNLQCRALRKPTLRTLQKCIKDDCPVLISMFEGEHYAVVFGVSPTHVMIANSSLDARLSGVGSIGSAVPRKEFREYWDRWGLAVSRP